MARVSTAGEMIRHADLAALEPVADALESLAVEFYIGGSVASSVHGVARATIGVMRVQRDDLDRAYIEQWASKLDVQDLLDRAWSEVEGAE